MKSVMRTMAKTLRAYLLTYWPEPESLTRTMVDYSEIEINFDELNPENSVFRWEYKPIETLEINLPAEHVNERLSEVNNTVRENLAKKNKLNLEQKLDACCFMQIESISQMRSAVKIVCKDLIQKYVKATDEKKNSEN